MKLDNSIDSFTDDFGGGSKRPPCKGYQMAILSATDTTSSAGNPMLVLELDITSGEYAGFFSKNPLRLYLAYHTDSLKGRLHRVLKDIISDNPGMFPQDALSNNEFDESKLSGLVCGGVLKYNDKNYLEIHYITTVEKALQVAEKQAPAAPQTGDTDSENLFS